MDIFDGFVLRWRDDSKGGPVCVGDRYIGGYGDVIRRSIWRDGTYKDERIDGKTGVDVLVHVFVRHHNVTSEVVA